jgi:hypothetical protein
LIWLALGLLGFAVTDLVQWSPDASLSRRTAVAVAGGACTSAGFAGLAGMQATATAAVGAIAVAVLTVWLILPDNRPGWPLAWIAATLTILFAASGSADPVGGDLERWYSGLAFPFVHLISVEQFIVGFAASLFLLATGNRIVRLVLEAAGTLPKEGETTLRGGRLLGPMERIIVGAIVVAGDPAGAALVIAAKGLLRFPEIRNDPGQPDQITEYFLIGTFTSLLLAALMAVLVVAAG